MISLYHPLYILHGYITFTTMLSVTSTKQAKPYPRPTTFDEAIRNAMTTPHRSAMDQPPHWDLSPNVEAADIVLIYEYLCRRTQGVADSDGWRGGVDFPALADILRDFALRDHRH